MTALLVYGMFIMSILLDETMAGVGFILLAQLGAIDPVDEGMASFIFFMLLVVKRLMRTSNNLEGRT